VNVGFRTSFLSENGNGSTSKKPSGDSVSIEVGWKELISSIKVKITICITSQLHRDKFYDCDAESSNTK